jgi:hypothetical protein
LKEKYTFKKSIILEEDPAEEGNPQEKLNNFYSSLYKGDMNYWIQEEQALRN